MRRYYGQFIDARAEKIEAFSATIAQLSQVETQISREKQRLATTLEDLNRQKTRQQQEASKRRATLAELNATLKNQDQRLGALKLDRDRLEQILAKVSNYIQDVNLADGRTQFCGHER